ncbi:MAG: ABC transporter substrate-binding protein [Desulfomicrobium sp.]|nr:ABC transporter substrate-binding protein [Pseudomonadota bacterium]MBU4569774.1 ABC transporter substrate-binding protein [Pseudomonadota bacterium]MBU4595497.1 ABC transporter substrate-binding protein [Pseudomonadota bacterium]MBV1711103.1 ABC transporter substrate-binding protein [Desulfomicrobium sp.]MBV1747143.1 ABC transporter substrate-binding protein [Desulfomicrobium sp.]
MQRFVIAALFVLITACPGFAKTYNVSVNQFVEHPSLDAVLQGFKDSLKAHGVETKYTVHNAKANMAACNQIAAGIAAESPDLVLAIATPSAQASAVATRKSPILAGSPLVFTAITDPVGAGLVDNLEKPGKNITGVSDMLPVAQHMSMLRRFYPDLKKLGIIYNPREANSRTTVAMVKAEGVKHGFEVVEAIVAKPSDVQQAAKSLVGKVDAVYLPTDNTVISALESVIKVSEKGKMPLFSADVDSVKRGTVAALAFDYYRHGYQTGLMAKRIMVDGVFPAETPVETQQELMLHLNLKAAKKFGVKVPEDVKKDAEKVYE